MFLIYSFPIQISSFSSIQFSQLGFHEVVSGHGGQKQETETESAKQELQQIRADYSWRDHIRHTDQSPGTGSCFF